MWLYNVDLLMIYSLVLRSSGLDIVLDGIVFKRSNTNNRRTGDVYVKFKSPEDATVAEKNNLQTIKNR